MKEKMIDRIITPLKTAALKKAKLMLHKKNMLTIEQKNVVAMYGKDILSTHGYVINKLRIEWLETMAEMLAVLFEKKPMPAKWHLGNVSRFQAVDNMRKGINEYRN